MLIHAFDSPPDLLALHARNPMRYPALLQSSFQEGWDILFAFPQECSVYPAQAGAASAFLSRLDSLPIKQSPPKPHGLPFTGGWFVYAGYEILHTIEPSVPAPQVDAFPLAALLRIPVAILHCRATGRSCAVLEDGFEPQLDILMSDIQSANWQAQALRVEALHAEDPAQFVAAVQKIQVYIAAGDVFQVNLSRQWQAQLADAVQPADVYAALRAVNPAPFSGIAQLGDASVISSSPERLIEVRKQHIHTRPIAGTHPRSSNIEEDQALKQRLIESPKERAEHIMLIDLERNDLGRICQTGTVKVDELMGVYSYQYVHHIESIVSGTLKPALSVGDLWRAMFPGGTITGCPKVRTMQIIRELESTPRGAYTGSMGYINHDGSLDTNILIRSFMLQNQQLRFRAGAGIVADSDPHKELAETQAKCKGLLRALGVVE